VAQGQPSTAAGDTPAVRLGATIFADYTYTAEPKKTDADGNRVNPSQFNVSRSYLNVTGTVSRRVAFRVTPDIARESGAGSSLSGSMTFRLKYAYAQLGLDDWVAQGSWTRLGMQDTAFVTFDEALYRYRFQGTVFVEREGFLSSSDVGASFRYALPSRYGDVHVGYFNGETYAGVEANDQKAVQVRGSVRPFAAGGVLAGLQFTGFHQSDHYVSDADRTRSIGGVTYEHRRVNAGFHHLWSADQTSVTAPLVEATGYSLWATPRVGGGWEGLVRVDRLTPNADLDSQERTRTILGVAYWLAGPGNTTAALLFDYEDVKQVNFVPARPRERRFALHALVNF
jgi:hypothetical protein